VGFDQVLIAFTLGTLNGLMSELQAHTDGFELVSGEKSLHGLLLEAALDGAHRIRVGLGLLGPLGGGAIGEQHEGTNDFITPLRLIDKAQLQLRKLRGRFPHHPFHPCAGRGAYVAYPTEAVTPQRRMCGSSEICATK
jgi:hypothetical protein